MNKESLLSGLTISLIISTSLYTFYAMIATCPIISYYPFALIPFSAIMVFLNALFLKKERKIGSIIIYNLAFSFLASCGLFVTRIHEWGALKLGLGVVAFISISFYTTKFSLKNIPYRSVLRSFDCSVIYLLIVFVYLTINAYPMETSYPQIAVTLYAFFSLILIKSLEGGSKKSISLTIIGMLLLLAAIFISITGAPYIGAGISYLWQFLLFIGRKIVQFVLFLISLFPKKRRYIQEDLIPTVSDSVFRLNRPVYGTLNENTLAIITISVISLIAAVIIFLFLKNMTVRGRNKNKKLRRQKMNQISFKDALRIFLDEIRSRRRKNRFIRKNFDNPIGFYFFVEKRFKISPKRKKDAETPKEFITRISEISRMNDMKDEYVIVEKKVSSYFYSSLPSIPENESFIPIMRSRLLKELRLEKKAKLKARMKEIFRFRFKKAKNTA